MLLPNYSNLHPSILIFNVISTDIDIVVEHVHNNIIVTSYDCSQQEQYRIILSWLLSRKHLIKCYIQIPSVHQHSL